MTIWHKIFDKIFYDKFERGLMSIFILAITQILLIVFNILGIIHIEWATALLPIIFTIGVVVAWITSTCSFAVSSQALGKSSKLVEFIHFIISVIIFIVLPIILIILNQGGVI